MSIKIILLFYYYFVLLDWCCLRLYLLWFTHGIASLSASCIRTMIVKFILKSLTQRDSSSARILQIEETPNHEFFPQVYDTKMFLLWKL